MRSLFGPTGDFPQGKLNPDDEGALNVGVTNKDGVVVINFGTPVAWFGMPTDQAIEFAKLIMRNAGVKSIKLIL
jgi:hypothetical protein